MATTQRVLMISGDCHAGPPQPAFLPYFDSHRAEAEDYCRSRPNRAAAEAAAEGDLEAVAAQLSAFMLQTGAAPETAASFSERALTMTAGLFDSKVRNECLDADGIAGEVIFPDGFIDNHPPFSDAMETEQKFRRLGTRNWPFELRLDDLRQRRAAGVDPAFHRVLVLRSAPAVVLPVGRRVRAPSEAAAGRGRRACSLGATGAPPAR
jgi:hypothetical protein